MIIKRIKKNKYSSSLYSYYYYFPCFLLFLELCWYNTYPLLLIFQFIIFFNHIWDFAFKFQLLEIFFTLKTRKFSYIYNYLSYISLFYNSYLLNTDILFHYQIIIFCMLNFSEWIWSTNLINYMSLNKGLFWSTNNSLPSIFIWSIWLKMIVYI